MTRVCDEYAEQGNYLVTAGMDRQVSVWDVRTYKSLHSYIMHAPATSIDLSQKDLLGVGFGSHVEVWTDCLSQKSKGPYMSHHFRRGENVCECKFCPFEDVLGVSHSRGFQSLIIPVCVCGSFTASLVQSLHCQTPHTMD